MNIRPLILFASLPFLAAACGNQAATLQLAGGPGTAAPADANGVVDFTIPSMQNVNVTDAMKQPDVEIFKPDEVESAKGGGFVNYEASDMDKIDRLEFTLSAEGLPTATIAQGAGPGKQMGSSTMNADEKTDFGAYLKKDKFTVGAKVTYKSPVDAPTLTLKDMTLGVQLRR